MKKHDFVTIADLTREKILYMIEMAQEFEQHPNRELLKGKVVATLFFEPSTRTRLSFETAANRLGARVIGFADPKITSGTKGETLKDTILMVSNYADVIVMRHFIEGAAQYASEVTDVPIVNAGDGAHQHPSQCMLDLYSIYKTQGTLENLNIYLVGDLKYGRTVHSLIMAMRHFNPTFHFVAPKELSMQGARHSVSGAYRLQRESHSGCRHPLHDACSERALLRFNGIRTCQKCVHSEQRHAASGQAQHAHPASPAPRQRDSLRCRRQPPRLLYSAGRQRTLRPRSHILRRIRHQFRRSKER